MVAQEVFSSSLAILQESGREGEYNASTYAPSAPMLINLLLGMLDEADCIIKGRKDRFDEGNIPCVSSLDDPILLHPTLARVALPLGLASLFVSGDQPTLAATLWQRFQSEKLRATERYRKSRRHLVRDIYFS